MNYGEKIDYLTAILSKSQVDLYERILTVKELGFVNLFTEAQMEKSISDPESFLHKLLIINLRDFDENKWSPTMYSSFIFKSLMLITALGLIPELNSTNDGSGLLFRKLGSLKKGKSKN